MDGRIEATLEFVDFKRRLAETGIAEHLSGPALTLLFIALGRKMWRGYDEGLGVRELHD